MVILERPRAVLEHQPEANHYDTLERDRMAAEQSTQTVPERWLPVPGWEGMYEVSDHGKVWSSRRSVTRKDGHRMTVGGKMLTPTVKQRTMHHWVRLMRDGKGTAAYVHRLVLSAFVGPCPDGMVACHYDDDPSNNRLDNLRWDSISENNRDMVRNGNHNFGSRTHCPRGHELAKWNLARSPLKSGHRNCLACTRASYHVYRHPELRSSYDDVANSYYRDLVRRLVGPAEVAE